MSSSPAIHCSLQHHGAAAAVSGNQVVTWLPKDDARQPQPENNHSVLVYASHAMINLAVPTTVQLHNGTQQTIRHVVQTLRCSALDQQLGTPPLLPPPVITAIASAVPDLHCRCTCTSPLSALVSGFSNGMIQIWIRCQGQWTEHTVNLSDESVSSSSPSSSSRTEVRRRSITTLDVVWTSPVDLWIAAGTSAGAFVYPCRFTVESDDTTTSTTTTTTTTTTVRLLNNCAPLEALHATAGAVAAVHFAFLQWPLNATNNSSIRNSPESLLFIGTAAPRHNKIHVYQILTNGAEQHQQQQPSIQSAGCLTGHEDWITSFAWSATSSASSSFLLASGSQDARIRLWKFRNMATVAVADSVVADVPSEQPENVDAETAVDDDDENLLDDDDDEEGESRLEIVHTNKTITSVTLEALLYGHEESITAVCWHPDPMAVYNVDSLLITSSMDRTILMWSSAGSGADGIWTPLSCVGSAGGILGGSIGSTLLGFCSVTVEPVHGRSLVGHAYGGSLHLWDLEEPEQRTEATYLTVEERAALVKWKASPSLTGHFGGVTDLCWEAASGDYLLTVSNDQTCRLWAPVAKAPSADSTMSKLTEQVWLELARPQVHGYDLSAVVSLSTPHHPHLLVTGSDEKELRAFDAPKTTVRILMAASGIEVVSDEIAGDRVERAYIPSLGLSNRASAADAAEEDAGDNDEARSMEAALAVEKMRLPLERDLGAVSLWPEVQKLFGHNTEIYCLASTVTGQMPGDSSKGGSGDILVASSAKARDAVDAEIRLWNVQHGKCVQVLQGGHKSTVASLCFSPDGCYLASSGKDRRLCLWQRNGVAAGHQPFFALAWAKDSAHKRIIWSVHFCPFDSTILASGSRDGCVKIWRLDNTQQNLQLIELFNFAPWFSRHGKADAVTALSFSPISLADGSALLALGLESGRIELWKVTLTSAAAAPLLLPNVLDSSLCHSATITRLAWRPVKETSLNATTATLYLASSSMDHGCRIFELSVPIVTCSE